MTERESSDNPQLQLICVMSALSPKADIAERCRHVRFVPKADILRRSEERRCSIAPLAAGSSTGGTVSPSCPSNE